MPDSNSDPLPRSPVASRLSNASAELISEAACRRTMLLEFLARVIAADLVGREAAHDGEKT